MICGIFVMMGLLLMIAALILNYLVLFVTKQKNTINVVNTLKGILVNTDKNILCYYSELNTGKP